MRFETGASNRSFGSGNTTHGSAFFSPGERPALISTHRKSAGKAFTLVEMLITLCILGLLAAISIPIYVKYVARARQADAKAQLLVIRQDQELYRLQNGAYASQTLRTSLSGWREAVGKYSFSITAADALSFKALASGDLDGDGTSDVWTIDQNGALVNTQPDLRKGSILYGAP